MRTWPARLAELYLFPPPPFLNADDPLRPWWWCLEVSPRPSWVRRSDRASIALYQDPALPMEARLDPEGRLYMSRAGRTDDAVLAEQRAQYDREHPLPHPGLRVGQIWANEKGEATFIDSAYLRTPRPGEEPVVPLYYAVSGGLFTRRHYPFLVHDVVCPWLAPWAPPEASP